MVLNYVNFGIQISTSFLTKKIVKNGYKSENSMNVCLVEKLGHSEHPDPALKTHNGRFFRSLFFQFSSTKSQTKARSYQRRHVVIALQQFKSFRLS